MNIHSHPEKEERDRDAARPCNQVIREKLLAFRELPGWSNNSIATKTGYTSSVVSQYLNEAGCVYPGDIAKFERAADDMLANEARRRASGVDTKPCDTAKQMETALEYIRKTTDIGIILDESGEGKTRGQEVYHKEHPTSILYPCFSWSVSKKAASSFLFSEAGKTGYDGRTPRDVHSIKVFRGSERLFIIDDAHNLHFTALKWWVDIHDATQCPLALVGTYKLLDKIEADPQIFSRVGLKFEIKKTDRHGKLIVDRKLLDHLIEQLVPGVNGAREELTDLCEQVAREKGHYRSVHKQLKVAVEIKTGSDNKKLTWPKAFRAAHTMLVRNYKLS